MLVDVDMQACVRHKDGIVLDIGPFKTRVCSSIDNVSQGIALLYSDYASNPYDGNFVDFHIRIDPPRSLRRWYRPQAEFYVDGRRPFKPLSLNHAYAFFEWGLNWCMTSFAHHYLIVHAAVVEKAGFALILPGAPGAGKSTLCAGLVARGWRLLSDELTLIPIGDASRIVPVPRPVGLKNESIDLIRNFHPQAVFGAIAHDTSKGTVSHMKPPTQSVRRSHETAVPRFVIFPHYQANSESQLMPRTKASSFMEMARQSFNYNVLGETGFDLLTDVVSSTDCYDFTYSDLEDGVRVMNELVTRATARSSVGLGHA